MDTPTYANIILKLANHIDELTKAFILMAIRRWRKP